MEYLTSCCNTAFHGSGRYVHHFRYLIIAEPFGIKQNTLYATTLPGTFSNYRYNTLQRCPFVGSITGGIYVVIIIVYSGKHHAPTAVVLGDICIAHNGNNPRFEISPRIKQATLIQAFIYRLTGKVVGIFLVGIIEPGLPPYPIDVSNNKLPYIHHWGAFTVIDRYISLSLEQHSRILRAALCSRSMVVSISSRRRPSCERMISNSDSILSHFCSMRSSLDGRRRHLSYLFLVITLLLCAMGY